MAGEIQPGPRWDSCTSKRYASMAGDVTMVAPRRLLAQRMAGLRDNVYSYRWDVAALNSSTTIGVQHFAEVCTP